MVERSDATLPEAIPTDQQPTIASPPALSRRRSIVVGLSLALGVSGSAWALGERQGFDVIGTGGVNRKFLPKPGEAAPDLMAIRADGSVAALSQYLDQPVWLNFWGSWCPPCRVEMPHMQAAWERLQPQGLVILAVSLDESPEQAFAYALRVGATYPIVSDPQRRGSSAYLVANFPTHILIDRGGIVRDVIAAPLDADAIVEVAQQLLALDEIP